MEPTPRRLIPRWYAATVVGFLLVMLAVMAPAALTADEVGRWPVLLVAAAVLMILVAAVRSLVLPRRRRRLEADTTGTLVLEAPGTLVWPLVIAWLLVLAAALGFAVLLVADADQVEAPGAGVAAVLGAVASLPDLVRLLGGRLHRWRLTLGPDGFTYRGYRTDVTAPWSKVHGASIQQRGPAGVVIDRKGTGPDVVVPITAFDVPAEQIVAEIDQKLADRRR